MTVRLTPLAVADAEAMVPVLADPALYEFTGGAPPTLDELTARYARQVVGHSSDGSERWFNWVVRLDSTPVGYVQATVAADSAEIAWVVSPAFQGRGVATEAARQMVALLAADGVRRLVAHIHPAHDASAGVAARLGLGPTDAVEDGEVRWVGDALGLPDFAAAWQGWHDAREQRLRDPRGWLAITAIHWLSDAPARFDDVPGRWRSHEDGAEVTLGPGETLELEGSALGEGAHLLGPLGVAGFTVTFGDAVAQVAERDGRPIVRPRHPDSPLLRGYRGTPCYPADPAWVLPGRYQPYPGPDGDAVGEVVLSHGGAEHRLVAWDEGDGDLWILFRDATSGVTTYPANRQLDVAAPGRDGRVEIDFNRAINMPCAYTDFATCPLPPPANTLTFAVEAGEKIPVFDAP